LASVRVIGTDPEKLGLLPAGYPASGTSLSTSSRAARGVLSVAKEFVGVSPDCWMGELIRIVSRRPDLLALLSGAKPCARSRNYTWEVLYHRPGSPIRTPTAAEVSSAITGCGFSSLTEGTANRAKQYLTPELYTLSTTGKQLLNTLTTVVPGALPHSSPGFPPRSATYLITSTQRWWPLITA